MRHKPFDRRPTSKRNIYFKKCFGVLVDQRDNPKTSKKVGVTSYGHEKRLEPHVLDVKLGAVTLTAKKTVLAKQSTWEKNILRLTEMTSLAANTCQTGASECLHLLEHSVYHMCISQETHVYIPVPYV